MALPTTKKSLTDSNATLKGFDCPMEEGEKPTCARLLSNDKLPGCRKSKAGTTKSSHANVCGDVENPIEAVFKINRTESDFTAL